MKDFEWFQAAFISFLKGFEVKYKFFEKGDFGSLNQIEFNSKEKGGEIDFWSTGRLSIFVWDYEKEEELLNVLLMLEQDNEKELAFQKLKELL
jgi:hypothetical protein